MNIYSSEPKDWRDLQNRTARFLSELGYNCEIEKNVSSVRGNVNIDVFAQNTKTSPYSIILCECKYWGSPIPQTVVHSFRTVVSEIGANHGFIISKSGFQRGSIKASKNTNINLLTWSEFLEYFKVTWINTMTLNIHSVNRDLLTYLGAGFRVFFKKEYENLAVDELDQFEALNTKYFNTGFYSMKHEYVDLVTNEFVTKFFEMNISQAEKDFGRKFNSYEEFFAFLIADAKNGINQFDNLFKQKLRKTF